MLMKSGESIVPRPTSTNPPASRSVPTDSTASTSSAFPASTRPPRPAIRREWQRRARVPSSSGTDNASTRASEPRTRRVRLVFASFFFPSVLTSLSFSWSLQAMRRRLRGVVRWVWLHHLVRSKSSSLLSSEDRLLTLLSSPLRSLLVFSPFLLLLPLSSILFSVASRATTRTAGRATAFRTMRFGKSRPLKFRLVFLPRPSAMATARRSRGTLPFLPLFSLSPDQTPSLAVKKDTFFSTATAPTRVAASTTTPTTSWRATPPPVTTMASDAPFATRSRPAAGRVATDIPSLSSRCFSPSPSHFPSRLFPSPPPPALSYL